MKGIEDTSRTSLDRSYRYCHTLAFHGMEYPLLISRILSGEKRNGIAACFASFRIAADELHTLLLENPIGQQAVEKGQLIIAEWEGLLEAVRAGKPVSHPLAPALARTLAKYDLSSQAWSEYANALRFHLANISLPDFRVYRDYGGWAYGAPLYTFVHILAARKAGKEMKTVIDPTLLSDDLGNLAFTVDVLKDVALDLRGTRDGMVFIPEVLLTKYNLDRAALNRYVKLGKSDSAFKEVVNDLCQVGKKYEASCRESLVMIRDRIGREEWFVLDLLLVIYGNFLNRIWEFPGAIFSGGFPIDPAMAFIKALKLQKDHQLKFRADLFELLTNTLG